MTPHETVAVHEELTVVVDGAEESTEIFHDYLLRDERIEEIKEDARGHGYPTEIFIVRHAAHPVGECECIQYETSHKPWWSSKEDND